MLVACFGFPLYQWVRFGLDNDLYSYTLLVPLVSAYLIGQIRTEAGAPEKSNYRLTSLILIICGLAVIGIFWFVKSSGVMLAPQDIVALTTLPFVLLVAGLWALASSPTEFRQAIFPLTFLVFMVPFPVALEHGIEALLQHGSAPPAYWLFQIAGTPLLREGLVFHLPGISIQIAPECSGIRSTLVLFMTSILAGHLFLRSAWKRVALTTFVIPLALVRNGLRVFTIGQLCVSVGPHMIDSPIHHRGGPIFFALSLIPFFTLVLLLVRADRQTVAASPTVS